MEHHENRNELWTRMDNERTHTFIFKIKYRAIFFSLHFFIILCSGDAWPHRLPLRDPRGDRKRFFRTSHSGTWPQDGHSGRAQDHQEQEEVSQSDLLEKSSCPKYYIDEAKKMFYYAIGILLLGRKIYLLMVVIVVLVVILKSYIWRAIFYHLLFKSI